MQDFAHIALGTFVSLSVSVCACLCATIVSTGLSENKTIVKITFVNFDIRYRIASLRILYSVTLTYFSKVKDPNGDLTAADAHSNVTNARTAIFRVAP